jgi:hypothetical protein
VRFCRPSHSYYSDKSDVLVPRRFSNISLPPSFLHCPSRLCLRPHRAPLTSLRPLHNNAGEAPGVPAGRQRLGHATAFDAGFLLLPFKLRLSIHHTSRLQLAAPILGTPLPLHILRYRTPSMFIMLFNPGLPIPINPSIKPFPWLDPA